MKKGDSYAMIQLVGAEYQAAVVDNLTIGGLTSWIGVPIIGSAKYAFNISENFHAAVGVLAGTGSWAAFDSYGVLPYGALTLGNNKYNVNNVDSSKTSSKIFLCCISFSILTRNF